MSQGINYIKTNSKSCVENPTGPFDFALSELEGQIQCLNFENLISHKGADSVHTLLGTRIRMRSINCLN